jgi:hypothetical protein
VTEGRKIDGSEVGSDVTDNRIKAHPLHTTSLSKMPTPTTKAASTTLGRASKRVSSAFKSTFGPYRQTDDQTQATLDTMRGWLEADDVNLEDLLVSRSSTLSQPFSG